jgi:hypothetical protein
MVPCKHLGAVFLFVFWPLGWVTDKTLHIFCLAAQGIWKGGNHVLMMGGMAGLKKMKIAR